MVGRKRHKARDEHPVGLSQMAEPGKERTEPSWAEESSSPKPMATLKLLICSSGSHCLPLRQPGPVAAAGTLCVLTPEQKSQ